MFQAPENCGEAAENGRAQRAPSPQFIVGFSGATYFGLTTTNTSANDIFLSGFQRKPKAPRVISGYLRLENKLRVPKIAEKQLKTSEHEGHLPPQVIVSFSGAMYFGITRTNVSAYDIFICGFQRKTKAPGVSSGSLRLENMLQAPEHCGEAAENERARSAPSPKFMVSFSGTMYFGLTSTNTSA